MLCLAAISLSGCVSYQSSAMLKQADENRIARQTMAEEAFRQRALNPIKEPVVVSNVNLTPIFLGSKALQCGPFLLDSSRGSVALINGLTPKTQKVTLLTGADNINRVMVEWMVERSDYPGFYGLEYIKRNGKAILNVEAIRANMDQSRAFGTFDCIKVE